jgi:hypothetical protein
MRVINISVSGISVILISLGGTAVICRKKIYTKVLENRKSLTVIECIAADGTAISLVVIVLG